LKTVEEDFLLAQSVVEAIGSGTIVPAMLSTKVTIRDIPGGKTAFVSRDKPILPEDLASWARNVQFALLGTWIQMVDQALEAKNGGNRLQDTDRERQAIRCVIYQMRCSVAHSSHAPKWEVRPGFRRSFTISNLKSGPITLNFAQLNGQLFEPSQFGGWYNVVALLLYAKQFL
jgi:hypothetical protein